MYFTLGGRWQWMSDVDMVNFGFPPQDNWSGPKLYSFEGSTPSLVTGPRQAFEAVLNLFLTVAESSSGPEFVEVNGQPHTSDMVILSKHKDLLVDLRYPASLRRTNRALNDTVLLHFSAAATDEFLGRHGGTQPKAALARSFRAK